MQENIQPNDAIATEGNAQKIDAITPDNAEKIDSKAIFDERQRFFTEYFQNLCEQEEVPVAVLLMIDPKIKEKPIIYMRGDDVDIARLMAMMLRKLKMKIFKELEA